MSGKVYPMKYCLVPQCKSTSKRYPDKLFFTLPKETRRRKLWLRAMGRYLTELSAKSIGYVCIDHFNLEEDADNYMRHKLMGGRIYLKKHAIPHIFECQENEKRKLSAEGTPVSKKSREELLESQQTEKVDGRKSVEEARSIEEERLFVFALMSVILENFEPKMEPHNWDELPDEEPVLKIDSVPNGHCHYNSQRKEPRALKVAEDRDDSYETYQNTKGFEVPVEITLGDEFSRPKRGKKQKQKVEGIKTKREVQRNISLWSHSLAYKIQEFDKITRKYVMQQIDQFFLNTKRSTMKEMSKEALDSQASEINPSSSKRMMGDDIGPTSPNETTCEDPLGETSNSYAGKIKAEYEEIDMEEELMYIPPNPNEEPPNLEFLKKENELEHEYEGIDSHKEFMNMPLEIIGNRLREPSTAEYDVGEIKSEEMEIHEEFINLPLEVRGDRLRLRKPFTEEIKSEEVQTYGERMNIPLEGHPR